MIKEALIFIIKILIANNRMLNDIHGRLYKERRSVNDKLNYDLRNEGLYLIEKMKEVD